MGIVFRQSVKSSVVTLFGAFLGAASNLIYPYILSKTELGFLTNIIYTGALLQVFMMMGMGYTLAIYPQKYPEGDARRSVLMTVGVGVTFLTTILFTIVYILLKEQIIIRYQAADRALMREYFYWVPLLILLMSFNTLFECYLISQTKTAIAAFAREVLLRILNFGLIALFFYHVIGFRGFIISNILVYIIPMLLLLSISLRSVSFGFRVNWNAFSREEYKDIAQFAWYHLLLGVSLYVMGYLDPIMLAALDKHGMETVAPYRMALFIIGLSVIPYRAMSNSSYATLNQAYIDNDMPRLRNLFTRAGLNIFIVTVAMFLLIGCNLDNAVRFFPKGYEVIKPIVLVLMVGRFIDMATGMNSELISMSKYYKFNFRVSILLVVLLFVFNRALIPRYGIYGAAWGSTIALVIFNILKMTFLWWKMQLQPFSRKNIGILVAALAAVLAGYFLPYIYNVIADTVIRSMIVLIVYAVFLILLKPSEDLNHYLLSVKKNRRLF